MKLDAEVTALRATEHELTELIGHLRVKVSAGNEELRRSKSQETTQHNTADKVLHNCREAVAASYSHINAMLVWKQVAMLV